MYMKAYLMNDFESGKNVIMGSNDPAEIKAFGRKVRPFNEALWLQHVQEIAFAQL